MKNNNVLLKLLYLTKLCPKYIHSLYIRALKPSNVL